MTAESYQKYLKLKLLTIPYKALLFDVDGTLADNIAAHKASYVAAALEYGVSINPDLIDETAGWPTTDVAKEITKRYQVEFDIQAFAKRKSAIFIERFIQQTKSIDYVKQVLLDAQTTHKIGIVSGGSRSTLEITLSVINVTGKVETLVCAGDTVNGKPSPEPFLLAAKNLHIHPKDCLVFEDGNPGVKGAIAAQMGWVRIDQV